MPDFSRLIDMGFMVCIMMAVGIILRKRNIITKDVKKGMTDIAIYVFLPCNILNSFRIPFDYSLIRVFAQLLLIAVIAQVVNQLCSMIFFRKEPFERKAVLRYATILTSAGFFGIAVVEGIYGSAGLLYAAIYQIPQRVAMWSSGIACFSKGKKKGRIRKILLHPCMIAVYLGMGIMVGNVELPNFLSNTLTSLGGCTIPAIMLLTGSILAEVSPLRIVNRTTVFYSLLRMLVIPAIVFAGCLIFRVEPMIMAVSVLMSGMPAATTTGLLASQYKCDEGLASMCLVVSTVLAIGMIPLWCFLVTLV